MVKTRLFHHSRFAVGEVSPWIFGGFLEHLGRSIYEGVYDPQSGHADADGMRTDVIEALRELALTIVPLPRRQLRLRLSLARRRRRPARAGRRCANWRGSRSEPNTFGTDEFIALCRKLDWQPMIAVNLGTGSPEEARDWVEYCNAPVGTRDADLRAANGSPAPHVVPFWCLGNENGRPVADWSRSGGAIRDPSPAGGEDDEGLRSQHRNGRLRFVGTRHADVPYMGPDRARAPRRLGGLRQPAPLRRQSERQRRGLPCALEQHRPADRSRRCLHPLRAGKAPPRDARASLLRRNGTCGTGPEAAPTATDGVDSRRT